jgi:hypothetical protein
MQTEKIMTHSTVQPAKVNTEPHLLYKITVEKRENSTSSAYLIMR